MNITMPETFSKDYLVMNRETGKKDRIVKAYIKDNILCLERGIRFRSVMYDMAKEMLGIHQCNYCKGYVPELEVTMDHLYPKSLGGPTITDNLVAACSKCNNDKMNMTPEEYETWKKLPKEKRRKYKDSVHKAHEEIRKKVGMNIPQKWIRKINITHIATGLYDEKCRRQLDVQEHVHYNRLKNQFNTYGTFGEPIVVDKNLTLLDGAYMYVVAKEQNVKMVPVIVLENVMLLADDKPTRYLSLDPYYKPEKRTRKKRKFMRKKKSKVKHYNFK